MENYTVLQLIPIDNSRIQDKSIKNNYVQKNSFLIYFSTQINIFSLKYYFVISVRKTFTSQAPRIFTGIFSDLFNKFIKYTL